MAFKTMLNRKFSTVHKTFSSVVNQYYHQKKHNRSRDTIAQHVASGREEKKKTKTLGGSGCRNNWNTHGTWHVR